jgi:hypothetical protein
MKNGWMQEIERGKIRLIQPKEPRAKRNDKGTKSTYAKQEHISIGIIDPILIMVFAVQMIPMLGRYASV